jgi:DNA-binding MarR family transcriptional regulator
MYYLMLRRLAPLLRAEGLSGTEVLTLWKVKKRGPLRMTELAGHVGVPLSTLTGILDRLAARGLVERTPCLEDRRCTLVQGTPALESLVARLAEAAESELQGTFGALPRRLKQRLLTDLQSLQHYLDQQAEESREPV